jgi:hypothetical protein
MAAKHWLIVSCLPALLASGCGYSQSNKYDGKEQGNYQWHSLYRQDIRTVAVPIFRNKSYTRGIEFQLTKAVINYMESSTPYKVVSRDKADTILEGEITNVRSNTVSVDSHSTLPQEQSITVNVNFVWKDLRSGKILAQQKGFEQDATYFPTLGESSYVGKQTGIEKLAMAIVQELQADW